MESVVSLLFVLLVLCSVEANEEKAALRAERNCAKMTKIPFYNPLYVLGKWRAYYSWGFPMKSCTYVSIKNVSYTTQNYYAKTFRDNIEDEPNWYEAELLIITGRGEEILLFPQGDVRGRFRALVNVRRFGLNAEPVLLINYAFKAFQFFKYLIMLNCQTFSGYLMARPNDTSVSVKEIISLADDVLPGQSGRFACYPQE